MKKFTILVDIDDVLLDTVPSWLRAINIENGLNVRYEDLVGWDLQLAYPSLTVDKIDAPLMNKNFWKCVKPKEGAQKYLKKLIDDGHIIYIASSSHYDTVSRKIKDCLFKYFEYLNSRQLIFIHNKQLLCADFLLDDGVHNCVNGNYRGVLMSAPYNWFVNESDLDIDRVDNWEEFYNYIMEKANECC